MTDTKLEASTARLLVTNWLHLTVNSGPAQSPPRCTKCNSPPINGQCTNHCIAIWWSVALRLNVAIKGLTGAAEEVSWGHCGGFVWGEKCHRDLASLWFDCEWLCLRLKTMTVTRWENWIELTSVCLSVCDDLAVRRTSYVARVFHVFFVVEPWSCECRDISPRTSPRPDNFPPHL